MWILAVQKLLTFFQQKISEYYVLTAKTVNKMSLNELVKLTMLEQLGLDCQKLIVLLVCFTALYKDDETDESFYAGIVAEAPNSRNELRYLWIALNPYPAD